MSFDAFFAFHPLNPQASFEKTAQLLTTYKGIKIIIDRERAKHNNAHIHIEGKDDDACVYDIIRGKFVGDYSFLSGKKQMAIRAFCSANRVALDEWFHSDANYKPTLVAPLSNFL